MCNFLYQKTPGTTNCVTKCSYSYYYTSYGQYKCTIDNNCPDEANLYIKELKKCTNDCSKEGNINTNMEVNALKIALMILIQVKIYVWIKILILV